MPHISRVEWGGVNVVDEVSPEEVRKELQNGGLQVVDIRSPHQFAHGHIPGAINIPFPQLPQRVAEHEWGDDIVVVCPIGQSSIQAARLLESFEQIEANARVASMSGGYDAWEYELDHETSDDAPF